jgi:hypothetical protein
LFLVFDILSFAWSSLLMMLSIECLILFTEIYIQNFFSSEFLFALFPVHVVEFLIQILNWPLFFFCLFESYLRRLIIFFN